MLPINGNVLSGASRGIARRHKLYSFGHCASSLQDNWNSLETASNPDGLHLPTEPLCAFGSSFLAYMHRVLHTDRGRSGEGHGAASLTFQSL